MNKIKYSGASVLFFLFALMYFLPINLDHKICYPLFTLFVFSTGLMPWQMCCALLFSGMGDYEGSCHNFLAQMGFFAAAHVSMVIYFVKLYLQKPRDWRLSKEGKLTLGISLPLTLAIVIFAFISIIPHADAGVIQVGTAVYCILISCMLLTASQQRKWLFTIGALLFVFSDTILAWNKFVSPVPGERYWIMVTYYVGQYLLFTGAYRNSLKAE